MSRCGDLYENKITGERAVVLRGDEDGNGQSGLVHLTVQPRGVVVGEHVHPQFRERFRVISGRVGLRVDGVESTLEAGQEAVAPAGPYHARPGRTCGRRVGATGKPHAGAEA